MGEVESEVGGSGPEGQRLRDSRLAGKALPQSSMKIGFTNHRRSLPTESSISHEQFSSWEADLRLEAGCTLGAESRGGSAELPPALRGFSEESQKPVETREEEEFSPGAGPPTGLGVEKWVGREQGHERAGGPAQHPLHCSPGLFCPLGLF